MDIHAHIWRPFFISKQMNWVPEVHIWISWLELGMTVCIKILLEFNAFKMMLYEAQGILTEKYKSNSLSPILRVM